MNSTRRIVLGVLVMALAPTVPVWWMALLQMAGGALLLTLGILILRQELRDECQKPPSDKGIKE
jgi:threonine/homoserine/homoserine lactone efflux protein